MTDRKRETVTVTRPPWEDVDPTLPRIRVNLSQTASGKWTRDQTIEWPAADPVTTTDQAMMHDQLDALDKMVREHITDLYERDTAERDEYFRQRDAKGYSR